MVRVCFVCLGNICRSPTAEGVLRHLVERAGLGGGIEVESAGTGDWHVGELPDPRTRAAALGRGLRLESRARQFEARDFDRFDHVLAMDASNLADLSSLARSDRARRKLALFRSFDPEATEGASVPDPYYGSTGFEDVLDICFRTCEALLAHLRREHGLG